MVWGAGAQCWGIWGPPYQSQPGPCGSSRRPAWPLGTEGGTGWARSPGLGWRASPEGELRPHPDPSRICAGAQAAEWAQGLASQGPAFTLTVRALPQSEGDEAQAWAWSPQGLHWGLCPSWEPPWSGPGLFLPLLDGQRDVLFFSHLEKQTEHGASGPHLCTPPKPAPLDSGQGHLNEGAPRLVQPKQPSPSFTLQQALGLGPVSSSRALGWPHRLVWNLLITISKPECQVCYPVSASTPKGLRPPAAQDGSPCLASA